MKIKYHIHINGPEIAALRDILEMIAQNNSEQRSYSLDELHSVCKAQKILYPSLNKRADYIVDNENQELICYNPDNDEVINWTIVACELYELKEDIGNFSNN